MTVKARLLVPLAAAILLAAVGSLWLDRPAGPDVGALAPLSGPPAAEQAEAGGGIPGPDHAPTQASPPASTRPSDGAGLVVRDVVVRDVDGRVAWRGDVDLAPELARIEAGVQDAHRNDGGVFGNREGELPERPRGYYREYVVRTPGISHAGPQRLILGSGGEVFYTSDHYSSFRRVR